MGITVLSSASLNLKGTSAGLQSAADGSAGNDFAALLTQQLLDPLQAAISSLAGTNLADTAAESTVTENTTTPDPAAALAAAGFLPANMAGSNLSQPATDERSRGRPTDETHPDNANGDNSAIASLIGQIHIFGQTTPTVRENPAIAAKGNEPVVDVASSATTAGRTAQEALMLSVAGNGQDTNGEAANIAVDTQPSSTGGQDFAATLAAQTGQAKAPSRNEHAGTTPTVSTPLHDNRWSQDFGDKVVWLAKNDQQVAQLNINPPQLGPVHITLNLNGDQASALFVSPHAEVRQAIEDSMSHLREVLAGAGINLGQANVGTQLPQQQNTGTSPQFSGTPRSPDDEAILRGEDGQGTTVPLTAMRGGRGMVDLFA